MLFGSLVNLVGKGIANCHFCRFLLAFTSVSHRLLLHKLRQSFNITGLAFSWIESYLSHRSQRVILDGKHADRVPVHPGVPEGSILDPILFSRCVADLASHIQTCSLSYADDVKILHKIKGQRDVVALQADDQSWASSWTKNLRLDHTSTPVLARPIACSAY